MTVTKQYINSATTGITMMASPVQGQTYYDNTTGNTMTYINGQWVQIAANQTKSKMVLYGSDGKKVDIDELADFMEMMKRRLCIITPNLEKHEKFPALKEAYEQYLVLDKLMREEDPNE